PSRSPPRAPSARPRRTPPAPSVRAYPAPRSDAPPDRYPEPRCSSHSPSAYLIAPTAYAGGPMTARARLVSIAALMLLAPIMLVVGVWIGGHPEDLPGFARRTFVAGHNTRVVNEALQRMAQDYYRPLTESQLANASISGAVASLNDRFSHYLSPAEYHSFGQPASFSGIGVE